MWMATARRVQTRLFLRVFHPNNCSKSPSPLISRVSQRKSARLGAARVEPYDETILFFYAGLPGDKISELKNMDTDQMLSLLVENRLINTYGQRHISDFVGDFNYLG